MFAAVVDTHAALWYIFGDPRLSDAAKAFIDEAAQTPRKIVLSAISLAEIVYLVEKQRIPATAYSDIRIALSSPDHVFEEAPLQAPIVDSMQKVSRTDIPDMPDRIAAATALYLGVPVISRDGRIRTSNMQTVW